MLPKLLARQAALQRKEERDRRANALKWLKGLERHYGSMPAVPETDLRRAQMLYEIYIGQQYIGDTSRKEHDSDDGWDERAGAPQRKPGWNSQCEKVRLFNERIGLEWGELTVIGARHRARSAKGAEKKRAQGRATRKRVEGMALGLAWELGQKYRREKDDLKIRAAIARALSPLTPKTIRNLYPK
ncbi:hypothetical protein [Candidatus Binatus sp.]|uniref:hypothetical protein n=1 Tax=Candidatus Binatus sp. TaxID=2811406 RepID=UPI003CC534A6